MNDYEKIKYIIEVVDNGSDKIQNLNKAYGMLHKNAELLKRVNVDSPGLRQLTRDAKAFHSGIHSAGASINMLRDRLNRLERGRNAAFRTDHIERYQRMIDKTRVELEKLEKTQRATSGPMGGAMSMMKGVVGGGLILGAGREAANFVGGQVSDSVQTSAKYEKYQAVLKNTLGSEGAANQAMNQITGFASSTPFQVDELTESYVKLANRGFKPTMAEMTKLGDLASSQGKSFDQLSEALLDAQTGEFERMKEFGVKAKVQGDKVVFNFKGQKTAIENNEAAIKKYILSLGDMKGVSGSMAAIAKTTTGQISNLEDNIDLLHKAIGDRLKPVTSAFLETASGTVIKLKEWIEVPVEQKIAKEQFALNYLIDEITDANIAEATRLKKLQELKENYPEHFKNLDIEKVKNEELRKKLVEVNAEYDKRIQKATYDKMAEDISNMSQEQMELITTYKQSQFAREEVDRIDQQIIKEAQKINPNLPKGMAKAEIYSLSQGKFNHNLGRSATTEEQLYYQQLLSQRDAAEDMIYRGDAEKLAKAEKLYNQLKFRLSALNQGFESLSGIDSNLDNANAGGTGGDGGNGGGNGGGTDNPDDINSIITGGSKPTNISITIGKVGSDEINIQASNIDDAADQIEEKITESMLRAVNSANRIAQ